MEKFEKNPKIKGHFEVVSEGLIKTLFSFIPAGPIFDSFWNYRANLKQKRVIDFSESVKKALEEISGKEIHSSNFETEDFVDVMEVVYMKVMNTRSEYKLERFRNILVNHIIEPKTEIDLSLKYIKLIDELSELQILLLAKSKDLHPLNILSFIESIVSLDNIDKDLLQSLYKTSEIEFHLNNLISMGLLQEIEIDKRDIPQVSDKIYNTYKKFRSTNRHFSNSELVYIPSEIAHSFLEFIELNGEKSS